MSNIDYGFNTDEVELEFDSVPEGAYNVRIDKEETVESKAGNKMIKVTYQILDGDQKGRLLFEHFNIFHPDEKTKIIAMQKIKRIALATGNLVDKNNPLKHRSLKVHVRNQKNNPEYTEVFKYEKLSDAEDEEASPF